MADVPQFLKVHCTNTDQPACALCARDFVIPLTSISSFVKSGNVALISFTSTVFCFDPASPHLMRYLKTEMLWDDLMTALDGEVADLGNINLSDLQKVTV